MLHVRRAAVQGNVDETKTHSSVRDLPLIEPLGSMVEAWRARCKNVTEGYVFPKASGGPLNVESLCLHVIKPLCKAAGVACRRKLARCELRVVLCCSKNGSASWSHVRGD